MKKIAPILLMLFVLLTAFQCEDENIASDEEIVTDIDGNTYRAIQIGNQTWTLENLKTTTLNDGTPLTEFAFPADWHNGNAPVAQFQYASTSDLNGIHTFPLPDGYYGCLYNHYAIETGKLAPEGWRIPTEADFRELENYLASAGYNGNQATVLKTGFGWLPSSGNGTDEIGFNGLPNGYASAFGTSTLTEGICTWATTSTSNNTRVLVQLYDQPTMLFSDNALQIGAGIRLIKD